MSKEQKEMLRKLEQEELKAEEDMVKKALEISK
jgi:hypothetical protein